MDKYLKFVNLRVLAEVHLLITEMKKRLHKFGIGKEELDKSLELASSEDFDKIKVILAGAYFSNIFRSVFIRPIKATKMIHQIKE